VLRLNEMNKCECGCGQETKYNKDKKCYNDYVHNHHKRGKHLIFSEEHKRNMSLAGIGRYPSKETRIKIGSAMRGKHHREDSKQLMSLANKGMHHSEETKQKIRMARIGKICSEETRQKISKKMKGRYTGEDNPMYDRRPSMKSSYGKHSICNAGYEVGSSYERDFSDGLYACSIEHIYEPERFHFKGISYLPDYLIVKLNLYIELKGYMTTKNKIQHELFRRTGHKLLVLGNKFFQHDKLFRKMLKMLEKNCGGD